jgi:hypothetical protein
MNVFESKEAFLLDTLEHYSEFDRCKNDKSGCYYSPERLKKEGGYDDSNTKGCAIGRHLTPELQMELDNLLLSKFLGTGVSTNDVFDKLPEDMKGLGQDFLRDVQDIHDDDRYWSGRSISDIGIVRLGGLIRTFKLDVTKFTKYLEEPA